MMIPHQSVLFIESLISCNILYNEKLAQLVGVSTWLILEATPKQAPLFTLKVKLVGLHNKT